MGNVDPEIGSEKQIPLVGLDCPSDLKGGIDDALGFDPERSAAAKELARWAGKRPALTRVNAAGLEESLTEAAAMMSSAEWGDAKPRHFVALWAMCHERVYKASAVGELAGLGWRAAVKAAAVMLRDEFEGEAQRMAEYVRWCWLREEGKERWCKERGYARRARVTWRHQFGSAMLADWRVEMARKGKR